MRAKQLKALVAVTRGGWRAWLAAHHGSQQEVWLVFYKGKTRRPGISYDCAVEEALCFGWIDSIIKRLDENRYVRKFTPRKRDSKWSVTNRQRYTELEIRGLLAPAGLQRPPTTRSYKAQGPTAGLPKYIEKALRKNQVAWTCFKGLAPSYRRGYVAWIDSAKQQETRERRLHEAVRFLRAGKKLGLK